MPTSETIIGVEVVSDSATTAPGTVFVHTKSSTAHIQTKKGRPNVSDTATKATGSDSLHNEVVLTKVASTASVSTVVAPVLENIEIVLPNTIFSESENKLTGIASPIDATQPASSNVISIPQGDTTTLETTAVTDVEGDLSVCRNLNHEAMFGIHNCNFQGVGLDLMATLQDQDFVNAFIMRT